MHANLLLQKENSIHLRISAVYDPGRAKTLAAFSVWRVLSLDDLSRRVSRFVDFLRLVRAYRPADAVLSGNWRIRGNLRRRGAYAFIAAINGPMPKMFMTRLRL